MGKDENQVQNSNQSVIPVEDQVVADQKQQEAVEKSKQEAAQQAELQQQLQAQELKKQQEFQAQQQAMQQQIQEAQAQKEAAIKQEIADSNADAEGGPSGFKRLLCFILLAFFIAFVIFLPQITDFVNSKISEANTPEITTGTLYCTLSKTTDELDVLVEADFTFINNEVTKLTYVTTYTGDSTVDSDELQRYNSNCINLKNVAASYDGVSVSCSLRSGISVEKQIFDYEKMDAEKISAAYTEAGGIYPEYKKGDKISDIESEVTSSGYTCKKIG